MIFVKFPTGDGSVFVDIEMVYQVGVSPVGGGGKGSCLFLQKAGRQLPSVLVACTPAEVMASVVAALAEFECDDDDPQIQFPEGNCRS